MLFILTFPQLYLIGSFLVVISVTCLGSSFVLLNSFLPLLVANHPLMHDSDIAIIEEADREVSDTSVPTWGFPDVTSFRLKRSSSHANSSELQLSTKISSKGVGLGYCAAVSVQCLSIVILYTLGKTSLSQKSPSIPLRIVLLAVGVCWSCGTVLTALWLRDRPGPPLGLLIGQHSSAVRSWLRGVSFAWGSLWKTIRTVAKLRDARIFLLAWFLLSDAIATVSGTAILFARTELKMGTVAIALLSITATVSGVIGAFSWPQLSKKFGLSTNHTIVACVLLMEIIPIYGLMGFLPFVQSRGVGGLQKPWEIYPLAVIHGFVMGGLSSYCRSFFGLLIPPGYEAAFYALYAVTDKGSSAIGPAIVGKIVDATGHIRPAFMFLLVIVALPTPLIWIVDAERGRKDAVAFAKRAQALATESYDLGDRLNQSEQGEALLNEDDPSG